MHGVCRVEKLLFIQVLLPITQNEAALAAVMGHEVSHALLQHGNQRMSQGIGTATVEAWFASSCGK